MKKSVLLGLFLLSFMIIFLGIVSATCTYTAGGNESGGYYGSCTGLFGGATCPPYPGGAHNGARWGTCPSGTKTYSSGVFGTGTFVCVSNVNTTSCPVVAGGTEIRADNDVRCIYEYGGAGFIGIGARDLWCTCPSGTLKAYSSGYFGTGTFQCLNSTLSKAPVCGDGTCSNGESCLLCQQDCGACPNPAITHFCSDSNQTIMKLDYQNNSLGAVWNYTPAGTNLVANPGFESGTGVTANSWQITGTAGSRSSDKAYSGTYSMKLTKPVIGQGIVSDRITVTPGATYNLSGWIYDNLSISMGPGSGGLYIDLNDIPEESQGCNIGDIYPADVTKNQWRYVSCEFITGAYRNSLNIRLVVDGKNLTYNTGDAWFDDISLTEVSSEYDICYNEIFGTAGNGNHICFGTNKVLGLSNISNALGSFSSLSSSQSVCYGNLTCTNFTSISACTSWGGKVVASLSDPTDASMSAGDDNGRIGKICCKEQPVVHASGNAYWSDMSNTPINKSDIKDYVKMQLVASVSGQINYTIMKNVPWWFDRKIASGSGNEFSVWQAGKNTAGSFETGDYYFTATLSDGSVVNSGTLTVTEPADNAAPHAVIVNPDAESRHLVGASIDFGQASYDIDDPINAIWDFGEGNTTTLTGCNTGGNCNTTYTYLSGGTKIFSLTAKESGDDSSRRQQDTDMRRIFVYGEGINVFAVISEPPVGYVASGLTSVHFNTNNSYVANCTSCTSINVCPQCPSGRNCYNVSGIINGVEEKKQCFDFSKDEIGKTAGKYNLWFNWTFDEGSGRYGNWIDNYTNVAVFDRNFYYAREHWANLNVGYEAF